VSKIAASRRDGRQRRVETRGWEIQVALRSDKLAAPALVADATGATVAALVRVIGQLYLQIATLGTSWSRVLSSAPGRHGHPHPARTWMILDARVLGEPTPSAGQRPFFGP
jgi:hypothetical protein